MILPAIVHDKLPDFRLSDIDGIAGVNTLAPNVKKGWDIGGVRRNPERTEEILAKTNGVLCTRHHRMRFFINEVKVSVGLSATWGQGRRIRDMYPQALSMPQYVVKGQSLTQEDYGLLCEFIHAHQQEAMGNGNTIQLSVREGLRITPRHEFGGAGVAGFHKPIEAAGFVVSMPRQHTRFVYTPTFEFEFKVIHSWVGIFSGPAFAFETVQKSFMEILQSQERPFSQAPRSQPPAPPQINKEEEPEPSHNEFVAKNKAFGLNLGEEPFQQPAKPVRK